ncbi:MAG TPA: aromatic ring-hydroxylating dioxygenase subunit alpha [Rhizomicrobium sp.]|jgi:Rieske 2Fe-2S family protein
MDIDHPDYRPGFGLPQAFYLDENIFAEEQACIFRANWFFAGHSVEVGQPGDYMTLMVGNAPILVVRDAGGTLRAHHNVCRHRGSLVCIQEKGRASPLVCPYHNWAYGLDGHLAAAPEMPKDFDRSVYSLKPVHAVEFDGLIFVNLAEHPAPIDALRDHLSPVLRSQGMNRARVALIRDYILDVNWKIVIENNRECYHCRASHPGYVSVQYDTENDNPVLAGEIAERLAECRQRWSMAGLDTGRVNTSSDYTAEWFRANRTPVRKGLVTESPDGQLVCRKLMGGFTDPDMGTARANTNINFWCHANSDYAHTVRITPVSAEKTIVRGYWLVDETAIRNQDYDPETVAAFHDRVMREDWEICRRQWQGVKSPSFEPGPLSPAKEHNLAHFIRWYVGALDKRP